MVRQADSTVQKWGQWRLALHNRRKYAPNAFLMGAELLPRLPDKRELTQHFSVLQLLP